MGYCLIMSSNDGCDGCDVLYSLMISNIPFPSFKKSEWVKNHQKQVLMMIFLIFGTLFIYEEVMIPLIITIYVISSIVYWLTHLDKFKGIFDWSNGNEAE